MILQEITTLLTWFPINAVIFHTASIALMTWLFVLYLHVKWFFLLLSKSIYRYMQVFKPSMLGKIQQTFWCMDFKIIWQKGLLQQDFKGQGHSCSLPQRSRSKCVLELCAHFLYGYSGTNVFSLVPRLPSMWFLNFENRYFFSKHVCHTHSFLYPMSYSGDICVLWTQF